MYLRNYIVPKCTLDSVFSKQEVKRVKTSAGRGEFENNCIEAGETKGVPYVELCFSGDSSGQDAKVEVS